MRLHSLTLLAAAATAELPPTQARLLNEALQAAKVVQKRRLVEALETAKGNASAPSPHEGDNGSIWDVFDSQNEDAMRQLEDAESTTEIPTNTPTAHQMTPAELYEEWWSDLSPEMQSAFEFLGWDKGELFLCFLSSIESERMLRMSLYFIWQDLWNDNGSSWSDDVKWKDLPLDAQQSAAVVGYNKETWDARVEAQQEKNEEEDNKDDDDNAMTQSPTTMPTLNSDSNEEVNKDDDDKVATQSPTYMPTLNDDDNREYVDDSMSMTMSMQESDMSMSAVYNTEDDDMKKTPTYMPTVSDDDDKFDILNDRNEVSGDDRADYEAALEDAAMQEVDDSR